MMNFKKLDIFEVVEVYKLMDEYAIDKGFDELTNYLDELPFNVGLISRQDLVGLKSLKMEIERIFCSASLSEQRKILIEEIMGILVRSNKISISSFKIKEMIDYCLKNKKLKNKNAYYGMNRYLCNRILYNDYCNEDELRDIEELVGEIEGRFYRTNQQAVRQELLKKVLELVNLSNEHLKTINADTLTVNDLIDIGNKKKKTNREELYEIFNKILQFKIEHENNLSYEELENLRDLITVVKKRFSKKIYSNERKELLKKLEILKKQSFDYYVNSIIDFSIKDTIEFLENFEFKDSDVFITIINKSLAERIRLKKFFSKEELVDKDLLLEKIGELSLKTKKEKLRSTILCNVENLIDLSEKGTDKILLEKKLKKVLKARIKTKNKTIIDLYEKIVEKLKEETIYYEELGSLLKEISKQFRGIPITEQNVAVLERMFSYITDISYTNPEADESFQKILKNCLNNFKKVINKKSSKLHEYSRLRNGIIAGDIVLKKAYDNTIMSSINYCSEQLDTASKTIYAIDLKGTIVVDGAFSITQDSGCYIFDVYVPDVPSFLKDNRAIATEAYRRGNSIHFTGYDNDSRICIDMLPLKLVKNKLSLLNNQPRKVLDFQYIFKSDGRLDSTNVSRKEIKVTYNLDPKYVDNLMEGNIPNDFGILDDFILTKELLKKVVTLTDFFLLKSCSSQSNGAGFAKFASIFTNYYLGCNSQFAIYYKNGAYVRYSDDFYTHSVTPLRKYVSDINLAFFENQLGIQSFKDKDLNFIENNIDEILDHLNQQSMLQDFVGPNYSFAKKYLK